MTLVVSTKTIVEPVAFTMECTLKHLKYTYESVRRFIFTRSCSKPMIISQFFFTVCKAKIFVSWTILTHYFHCLLFSPQKPHASSHIEHSPSFAWIYLRSYASTYTRMHFRTLKRIHLHSWALTYIRMHLPTLMCTFVHSYAFIYIHTHSPAYNHMHLPTLLCINLHSYALSYTQTHSPTFIRTQLHSHAFTYTLMHQPTLIFTFVHSNAFTYIHTH